MDFDLLIVGAGPGGIFSAYEAMKLNPDVYKRQVYQNPVLNLIMIAVENHFAVVLKERNGFSGIPALVLQRKM